jgi:hypothetical protein
LVLVAAGVVDGVAVVVGVAESFAGDLDSPALVLVLPPSSLFALPPPGFAEL